MSIFRHEVRPLPSPEPNAVPSGAASDVPDVPSQHHDETEAVGSKPYLAIPEGPKAPIWDRSYRLTGAALKAFVAAIPDDAIIHYIDVGEGKHLHLHELLDGVAITGKA